MGWPSIEVALWMLFGVLFICSVLAVLDLWITRKLCDATAGLYEARLRKEDATLRLAKVKLRRKAIQNGEHWTIVNRTWAR